MDTNKENTYLNSLFEKIKNNKIIKYILIASLLIILTLLLTFCFNEKGEKAVDNENYVTSLEDRLEKALSKVEGAGDVKVVITVESGMETVLAMKTLKTETEKGVEIEETPILVNGKTVTLMEKYPKIIGVLIVLEGNNFAVRSRIQEATTSLLNISLSQIEILTMK